MSTFLQTGIDPLAVKLENDEEDDLMQMEEDAFITDGEEEEMEEDLKDEMKDLNMLPDKCEVPKPDLPENDSGCSNDKTCRGTSS